MAHIKQKLNLSTDLEKKNKVISTEAPGKDYHPMFLLSITISKLK